MENLDFKAEYAKSGRASCKKCQTNIGKDSLRLAKMIQSFHFDGKMATWYHLKCFFQLKKLPSSLGEIEGVDKLRWDDQQMLKQKIEGQLSAANGKDVEAIEDGNDFIVEHAKSSRSKCIKCEKSIEKEQLRISAPGKTTKYVAISQWRHVDCFYEDREAVNFDPEKLSGLNTLEDVDADMIRKKLGIIAEKPSRKRKKDQTKAKQPSAKKPNVTPPEEEKNLKKQTEEYWKIRDKMNQAFTSHALSILLEINSQFLPKGESNLLDACADVLYYGTLPSCPECGGKLTCNSSSYQCKGNISEWTRCMYSCKDAERGIPDIPAELIDESDWLKKFKFKAHTRVFPKASESVNPSGSIDTGSAKSLKFLDGFSIVLDRGLKIKPGEAKKLVEGQSGYVSSTITDTTLAMIAVQANDQRRAKIKQCKENRVPVLSEDVLEHIKEVNDLAELEKYVISDWVTIEARARSVKENKKPAESNNHNNGSSRKPADKTNGELKAKMKMKGGAVIDPDSGVDETCHVAMDTATGEPMCAILGLVDIARGSNSYYKIQLLQGDFSNDEFYVFRSWGRIGTEIGGNKLEQFTDGDTARQHFENVYFDKTSNVWSKRKNFTKHPGKFFPMDIDYGEEKIVALTQESSTSSLLPTSVQTIVKMIFDLNTMQQALLEFEIDIKKMPLGKISKRQIKEAFALLSDIQILLESGNVTESQKLDVSNRFFTLIPHDFGIGGKIPILADQAIVQSKSKMLNDLLDLEIVCSLMRSVADEKGTGNSDECQLDIYYRKLKCDMSPLETTESCYHMIMSYIDNTHASTHNAYTLKVQHVFEVDRLGERDAYMPFKQSLHNKQLLWHGSRVTNYGGILSQGLRIAPPEAPCTGYMFGKGVYFADMVSKSANYCFGSQSNAEGLLLLCEVALGDMYERTSAQYIRKLPVGKHSTKGVGKTMPDPKETVTLDDGVLVPLGKGVPSNVGKSSLLYNEYIVYDVNQINVRYLVYVKFEYK